MWAKWVRGVAVAALLLTPIAGLALPQGGTDVPPDKDQLQARVSQFQKRFLQNVKTALGCTDEEFKILEPKVERVLLIQFEQAGGYTGRRGRGATGPLASIMPQSEVMKARLALQDAVENKDVLPAEIVRKLKELREARAAARTELVRAQDDLRDFLTVRQEAVLVTMGLLE